MLSLARYLCTRGVSGPQLGVPWTARTLLRTAGATQFNSALSAGAPSLDTFLTRHSSTSSSTSSSSVPGMTPPARTPRAAVAVVLTCSRQERVALVKRGNPPNAHEWSLPGGKAFLTHHRTHTNGAYPEVQRFNPPTRMELTCGVIRLTPPPPLTLHPSPPNP